MSGEPSNLGSYHQPGPLRQDRYGTGRRHLDRELHEPSLRTPPPTSIRSSPYGPTSGDQILLAWLDYRRRRRPNTASPHLLINQMTALETGPVSGWWIKHELHGQDATLERLRVDRQLE